MNNDTQEKYCNSKILTLSQIFNGSNCFTIPDYQRAYSWGTEQRQDLIGDIENILETKNHIHYTGTIVATELFSNSINAFNVVDGQQRITSLIILLACLRHHPDCSKEQKHQIENTYLFKGKETGNTTRFFSLNGELDEYFLRKLEEPEYSSEEHNTKAHTNISDAFNEFREWLKELSQETITNVIDVVCAHLGFLFYVPNSDKEAGLMFEVINNRGKELSELEKIKNYLIYFAEKAEIKDLYTTVNNYWGKILFHLNACGHTSNQDENNFLRNTWIVFQQTNKSESYHVYRNLKKSYPPVNTSNWKRLIEYVKFLEIAAETYNKLFTRNFVSDEKEKQVLKQLAFQNSIASVLPLILSVAFRFKTTEQRVRLYQLIEKLNFRYYGCGVSGRSDSGNGHLFGWANQLFKNCALNEDWLAAQLIWFINDRCNAETFIKYLTLDKDESGDYYHWGGLKYFLANYEEYLAEQHSGIDDFTRYLLKQDYALSNASYEKEHILAREENSVIAEDEQSNLDVNKRRLGNFVLLTPSLNKSVQKDPIYIKLNSYIESAAKYSVHRSLGELSKLYGEEILTLQEEGYTRENIVSFLDRREKQLIKFALKRWGIDNKEKELDFEINSLKEDSDKVYFIHHLHTLSEVSQD
jgi:hypothetical protein